MNSIPKGVELEKFISRNLGIIELPIKIQENDSIWEMLDEKWYKFQKLIKNTSWLTELSNNVENEIETIKNAVCAYYSNNIASAKDYIQKTISISSNINPSYVVGYLKDIILADEYNEWYRTRVGNLFPFSHDDMFHIPFSKRGIIKNERYSINGIPCLYLGNSLYVCWEEMRRPSIDSLSVSRFKINHADDFKVINLALTPIDLVTTIFTDNQAYLHEKLIFNFFNAWILQSACSVVINDDNRFFREEYIVPQLIMQCLKDCNLNGVIYFSNRVEGGYITTASKICKNLAVPAADYNSMQCDYSQELQSAFDWSRPINIGLWRLDSARWASFHQECESDERLNAQIYFENQKIPRLYGDSIFYEIESELHNSKYYET